jgi:hypothetical protein
MTDKFLNPITMSFELLERYKLLLRRTLSEQGLAPAEVDEILQSIQVDRGVYFSLNRKYLTGQTTFRQFCDDHSLAAKLPDSFPKLASKALYAHQEKAILSILAGRTTVVSTGTGSGKTEAFLVPILDHCLTSRGPGVKAIIIYPMNALANDQVRRLEKATVGTQVTFGLFVGSTDSRTRNEIRRDPPDILITNYVMLDWMLTRLDDQAIFEASRDSLKYIVLDEIHTYRGNKATHLKYLLARLKSRFPGPFVQVGTSATLKSDKIAGYLQPGPERLNRFIQPLLDVQDFEFVEPEYVPEPQNPVTGGAFYVPDGEASLGWALDADRESGLENLGRLMGKRYSAMDFARDDISQAEFFLDLQEHPFVRAVRNVLVQEGGQNFVQLTGLLCTLLPPSYPSHRAEEMAKAYLSAVAFANHHTGSGAHPLLDFRVHLFLRDIGGYLKRCIKCHKYHSGNQEFCQDCGFPLFCVYRHDIRKCVGKVSDNRLKWELRPESNDRKNTYYVLLSAVEPEHEREQDGALRFRDDLRVSQDEIILDYDVYGRLRLILLPVRGYTAVQDHIIALLDRSHRHQYLHNLVKSILDFQPRAGKKLLGFIDNRERASQYASVLQDEFASEFLEQYLKLCLPEGREMPIISALEILHRRMPPPEERSPLEQGLFEELNLWYWRNLGMPPRYSESKKGLLDIEGSQDLTSLERELLGIFIMERAIAKDFAGEASATTYIKFEKEYATDHKGIHCKAGEGSGDPRYPSISLGEGAQEYASFVEQYGQQRISETVAELVERDWLRAGRTSDGKIHYYLNPRRVRLNVPSSSYDSYEELRANHLLTAAVHSSEVTDADRRQVEADFQEGALNFVMATPTLEMGIDIGKLQTVLMVGVPPLPSNYAQRAGRAGRDHRDQFALIVTFCSESSEHDSYYFHLPKLMINGVITPPSFNPLNPEVVEKHLHAFMLAGHVGDDRALAHFCANVDPEIEESILSVRDVFGPQSGAVSYLQDGFKGRLLAGASAAMSARRSSPQQEFYRGGFFPDYSFRRNQVYLVDRDKDIGSGLRERQLAEVALSEREPELAYYKFAPGEITFIAGGIFQITSEGSYTVVSMDATTRARSYHYLLASQSVRYAAKHKELKKYDRKQIFDNDQPLLDKGKVLSVAFAPSFRLRFVNQGCLRYESTEPFSDDGGRFNLGYEIHRQAIVLRFDKRICADETLYLSLVSALDRTVKDCYGLDESEIRLLVDASPDPPDPDDSPWLYVVLYDADGNENVPLEAIYQDFDSVVETAHHNMLTCAGSPGRPCESGCYLCMRSYATHHFAGSVDKDTALMFTGYLLGKNRFQPSIPEPEQRVTEFDLELRLERSGDAYTVHAPNQSYRDAVNGEQNKVIFDLLTQAIQSEFSEEMRTLRIRAREDYVVDAINAGRINKNKEDFARLQFNLLRFKHMVAEKDPAR